MHRFTGACFPECTLCCMQMTEPAEDPGGPESPPRGVVHHCQRRCSRSVVQLLGGQYLLMLLVLLCMRMACSTLQEADRLLQPQSLPMRAQGEGEEVEDMIISKMKQQLFETLHALQMLEARRKERRQLLQLPEEQEDRELQSLEAMLSGRRLQPVDPTAAPAAAPDNTTRTGQLMQGVHLRIGVVLDPPLIMRTSTEVPLKEGEKETAASSSGMGNDKYSGIIIDLLKEHRWASLQGNQERWGTCM